MSSGGGKQTKYDDAWISQKHDEFQTHIDNLGQYNEHRYQEHLNQQAYLDALGKINETQSAQLGTLAEYDKMTAGINETQSTQIGDLYKFKTDYEKKFADLEKLYGSGTDTTGPTIGDVTNLEDRIDAIQKQYEGLDIDTQLDALASSLRGEFKTDIENLDINPTQEVDLAQLRSDLIAEYPELFENDFDTSQFDADISDLESRLDSFEGFKAQSASNLDDVETALRGEIGDLSQSLTAGLGTLRSEAGTALDTVYKTRDQALAGLSGAFGQQLRAQEASLGKRIDETGKDIDQRIAELGSMMNYRMLGDSAGGVKMRRSKAYKSGAVQTGTGQLGRTMKLKTLNI